MDILGKVFVCLCVHACMRACMRVCVYVGGTGGIGHMPACLRAGGIQSLICLPGVSWWLGGSSSRCPRVVCGL